MHDEIREHFTALLGPVTPSVSIKQLQYYNCTGDTSLTDMNGVAPKWVAIPFSSDCIDFIERSSKSVIAKLTLHSY